jgi:hypothetical protein
MKAETPQLLDPTQYKLPTPDEPRRRLALGWLTLGIAALIASGLFSILLVASRTPQVMNAIPWKDFFHTALVVHVDLSVLVWFVAFGGVLWSFSSTARAMALGRAALAAASLGALVMAVSPFAGAGTPLMSNYIPVLHHPLFHGGLALFGLGGVLLVARAAIAAVPVGPRSQGDAALRFGLNAATVASVLAIAAFAWSYLSVSKDMDARAWFELVFWGGGHLLQYTYTLLLMVAWLWLASAAGVPAGLTPRVVVILFALGVVTAFYAPVIYFSHAVASVEHVQLFTWIMRYGGALATVPLGLALLNGLMRAAPPTPDARPLRAALLSSLVLFGFGGVIGYLIHGSNVTIPAHYHGSIVGVTLAFMGLTYHLMPVLGLKAPDMKWARLQPYIYAGGQLMHISGLLWSGGYGTPRKVAGAEQGLDRFEQIAAMGVMGLGGLIAIIGGIIFLMIVLRALPGSPALTRFARRGTEAS